MKKTSSNAGHTSYIFQLEVLVEADSNGAALEQLLHALNSGGFPDYRIHSGISLGGTLDEKKAAAQSTAQVPVQLPSEKKPSPAPSVSESALNIFERIKHIMKHNLLIRLVVNKGLGITLNIPCRIINMNENDQLITVYHVDEKQVYTFRMNEIEDFIE